MIDMDKFKIVERKYNSGVVRLPQYLADKLADIVYLYCDVDQYDPFGATQEIIQDAVIEYVKNYDFK